MRDIVEILRSVAKRFEKQHAAKLVAMCNDSAGEIERLRAVNADLLGALQEIKRCNEQYNFGGKLLRIVLPAIAKAEGR